ncbi:hypothetical protein INR49_025239 [Caranx melampygus]|nr:hypothetical protein INR49_025239 [Caranx melampygus]
MNAAVVKKTQDTLGKVIKKPPLTEKLLSKPPFRYLHDIFSEVIRTTGFMKGLYGENEMKSDNVKDKDSKIVFLQKAIDVVMLVSGEPLAAKPARIVAGHEPEKTNELLQAIAKCCLNKMSSDDAVKRVLAGEKVDTKTKASTSRSQDKENREGRERHLDREDKKRITERSGSRDQKDPDQPKEQESRRRDGEKEHHGTGNVLTSTAAVNRTTAKSVTKTRAETGSETKDELKTETRGKTKRGIEKGTKTGTGIKSERRQERGIPRETGKETGKNDETEIKSGKRTKTDTKRGKRGTEVWRMAIASPEYLRNPSKRSALKSPAKQPNLCQLLQKQLKISRTVQQEYHGLHLPKGRGADPKLEVKMNPTVKEMEMLSQPRDQPLRKMETLQAPQCHPT